MNETPECPHCDAATAAESIQGKPGRYLCTCCGREFEHLPVRRVPRVSPS